MPDRFQSTPSEDQTLRLPASKLDALEEWATEGTGLTAAARVTDSRGRIALVKNGWSDGWILPGGAVETGESPDRAARREVREETELDATVHAPVVVLDQTYVDEATGVERFSARYVVYAATADGDISEASRLGLENETISDARWFDSLPENLHDGELLRPYLTLK